MLFRVSPSGPYANLPLGGNLEVATIAALGPLPDDGDTPDLVWVRSVLCLWHRNRASTLAVDGITVVAASGGGNWERMVPSTAPDWLVQADWGIDPMLGDDENPGTTALPLRTSDELDRRLSVGTLRQETTVTVPAGAVMLKLEAEVDPGPYRLIVDGVPTTLYTGTVDTFVDRVHAGAVPQGALLTDLGIADWGPWVNQRIRITDGASVGAIAWVAKANPNGLGLNVARTGRFTAPVTTPLATPVIANPAPGDHYVIESLPTVTSLSLTERRPTASALTAANGAEAFRASSLRVAGTTGSIIRMAVNSPRGWVIDGCNLDAFIEGPNTGDVGHHRIARTLLGGPVYAAGLFIAGGGYVLTGCLTRQVLTFCTASTYRLRLHTAQGYQAVSQATAFSLLSTVYLNDVQVFDATHGVLLQNGCIVNSSSGLSGQGNTTGMTVGDDDNEAIAPQFFTWYQTADIPNLLGTTEIRINAATGDMTLTWATLVAEGGFDSDEQRGTTTLVAGTKTVTGVRNPNLRHPFVCRDTPGAGALGSELIVPIAGCTATQFRIDSINPAGAVVATDVSTVAWLIPAMRRHVMLCQANGKT